MSAPAAGGAARPSDAPAHELTGGTRLRAHRETLRLRTADGLDLAATLALPEGTGAQRPPAATLIALHPLPSAGGSLDTPLLRRAADRLPALAGIAVLRLNTRGTASASGRSEGTFADGVGERWDVRAAVELLAARGLPRPWLLGFSFGADLALLAGPEVPIAGAVLLSPPLRRPNSAGLARWAEPGAPELTAVLAGRDSVCPPAQARARLAAIPQARVREVPEAGHLWPGERQARLALDEIVRAVCPGAAPLPGRVPESLRSPDGPTRTDPAFHGSPPACA